MAQYVTSQSKTFGKAVLARVDRQLAERRGDRAQIASRRSSEDNAFAAYTAAASRLNSGEARRLVARSADRFVVLLLGAVTERRSATSGSINELRRLMGGWGYSDTKVNTLIRELVQRTQ